MSIIHEPDRMLNVESEWDVLVAGGGFAGISAALAAAREGSRVCLIEREWLLGGLGTLGLISIFLPLCDGEGHQVIAGVGEEWMRLALRDATPNPNVPFPAPWLSDDSPAGRSHVRFQAEYNPWTFALRAEDLLNKSGVAIRYGVQLCNTVVQGSQMTHVIVEDKGGRFALAGKAFVDATGDADLCRFAGLPTEIYRPGNRIASWYGLCDQGSYRLKMVGACDVADAQEYGLPEEKRNNGLDGLELNQLIQRSHEIVLSKVDGAGSALASLPAIPQIRMTRRLVGQVTLGDSSHQIQSDSIGMTGNWRKRGPIYELPLGILRNDAISNLFAAGRCVSVTDEMWDITRVIPACTVTGQAAGIAASLSASKGTLQIPLLQTCLRRQGVLLHQSEIKCNAR